MGFNKRSNSQTGEKRQARKKQPLTGKSTDQSSPPSLQLSWRATFVVTLITALAFFNVRARMHWLGTATNEEMEVKQATTKKALKTKAHDTSPAASTMHSFLMAS